jgi:hypothetical protein
MFTYLVALGIALAGFLIRSTWMGSLLIAFALIISLRAELGFYRTNKIDHTAPFDVKI